ncbi:hypothetical protein HMPREF0973_01304 [Prevotella veroralis F0319]|uniref:Uncharacterized protein n=1 Tax=Prevotella veroralis F0319 TaxID=649761 RepID=C9MNW6_9BACT|nr:hypothetical protein HMPREF0973_01304 [Prevotella veroralis F0319]
MVVLSLFIPYGFMAVPRSSCLVFVLLDSPEISYFIFYYGCCQF